MKPPTHADDGRDRIGEIGLDYYTELTVQYIEDTPEAKLVDVEPQADRNVVWFKFDGAVEFLDSASRHSQPHQRYAVI